MKKDGNLFFAVGLIVCMVISLLLLAVIDGSALSKRFHSISSERLEDNMALVSFFIVSFVGTYVFMVLNVIKWFKNILGVFFNGLFAFTLLVVSLIFIYWFLNLKVDVEFRFLEISFPTDPDIVGKNLKLDILDKGIYMLISIIITSLLLFIFSMLKLISLKVNSIDKPKELS